MSELIRSLDRRRLDRGEVEIMHQPSVLADAAVMNIEIVDRNLPHLGHDGLGFIGYPAARCTAGSEPAAEVQAPFNVAGIGRPRLWTVALNYRW